MYQTGKAVREEFQHTAARRRLVTLSPDSGLADTVSTHSRPKAAGLRSCRCCRSRCVSTHSRPKAAGSDVFGFLCGFLVSTHSRPKAAGAMMCEIPTATARFNTQPPEGGWTRMSITSLPVTWFQHTAARRRLGTMRGGCRNR